MPGKVSTRKKLLFHLHAIKPSTVKHNAILGCYKIKLQHANPPKLKGRATLIVLRSVISIFTSASGGGWWKLFLVIKGMVVPDLKFMLFFHRVLMRKWLKYVNNIFIYQLHSFSSPVKVKNKEK